MNRVLRKGRGLSVPAALAVLTLTANAQTHTSTAVSWGANRLDAFAVAADGKMYHDSWNGASWQAQWDSRGAPAGGFSSAPATVSWGFNRLDVFAVGLDGQMYHNSWNGALWQAQWDSRGAPAGGFSGAPAAVSWGANRLDVFAVGMDGKMYHTAWNGTSWQTQWDSRGAPAGGFSSAPTAVSWGFNRLDVFAVGADGNIHHNSWNGASWQTQWDSRGAPAGGFSSAPAAVSWGANRLDVFAVGLDGKMYHTAWNGLLWQAQWDSRDAPAGGFSSAPAAVSWGFNRLDVFAVGSDGQIHHNSWSGALWQTQWDSRGAPAGGFSGAPAAVSWGANRLDVFAVGLDGKMYHTSWNGALWQGQWDSRDAPPGAPFGVEPSSPSSYEYAPGRSGPRSTIPYSMADRLRRANLEYEDIDGLAIVEGDIILGKTGELQTPRSRTRPPVCGNDVCTSQLPLLSILGESYLWPGGVIPYEIDPAFGPETRRQIGGGIEMINSSTHLLIVPRRGEKDYIYFTRVNDGCSAKVGRQGDRQEVNIMERACGSSATAHEILHAAGIWHEQSRSDRDNFVEILWQNIQSGKEYNFAKHEADGVNIGSYDLQSIMHYSQSAFGKKDPVTGAMLPTIRAIHPGGTVGGTRLSANDIAGVNLLYPVTASERYVAIPSQVFGLRHSINQANDIIRPLVTLSGTTARSVHGGDLGAPSGQGYNWWMVPSDAPMNSVQLEEIPPGIILGLWHSDNMSAITADTRLSSVMGGDLGAPSGHGFVWYETQLSGLTNWALVDRLPPYTVVGLKHSVNQRNKTFVWRDGQTYDPLMYCPEGFDKKNGGDSGGSSGEGFYWCEKRKP
jgi:hypothetical protein